MRLVTLVARKGVMGGAVCSLLPSRNLMLRITSTNLDCEFSLLSLDEMRRRETKMLRAGRQAQTTPIVTSAVLERISDV